MAQDPGFDFVNRLRQNSIFPTGGYNPFQAPQRPAGIDPMQILNAVQAQHENDRQNAIIQEDNMHRRQVGEHLQEVARQNALQQQARDSSPLRAQGGMNVVLGGNPNPGKLNGETLDQADANRFDPYFKNEMAPDYTKPEDLPGSQTSLLARGQQTTEGNKQVATATAKAAAATQALKDAASDKRAATKQENEVGNIALRDKNEKENITLRDKNSQNMVDVKEKSDLDKKAVLADIDKKNKQEQVRKQAEDTLKSLDEILDPKTNSLTEGARQAVGTSRLLRGGPFGFLPGSDARTANAKIKTFTSQTVLNLIGELKAQSKSGGNPLGGNMSDKDLVFLESAANSLDPYGDEDQYEEQLRNIKQVLTKASRPIVGKVRSDGNNDPGGIR